MKSNVILFYAGTTLNLITIVLVFFHLAIQKRRLAKNGSILRVSRKTVENYGLSKREKEIALSILAGKTNTEIAQEMFIAVTTVKKHVYNLYNKTSARNRIELINRLRSHR